MVSILYWLVSLKFSTIMIDYDSKKFSCDSRACLFLLLDKAPLQWLQFCYALLGSKIIIIIAFYSFSTTLRFDALCSVSYEKASSLLDSMGNVLGSEYFLLWGTSDQEHWKQMFHQGSSTETDQCVEIFSSLDLIYSMVAVVLSSILMKYGVSWKDNMFKLVKASKLFSASKAVLW